MPVWPLWVVEAADSKVGNIALAPMPNAWATKPMPHKY